MIVFMGLNFRKSIKIGKNTRINFSKTGGIGISTGFKGARVSINKKGIRTSVGAGGIRYTTSHSFNRNKKQRLDNFKKLSRLQSNKHILSTAWRKATIDNKMLQNHTQEEINEFRKTHYTRHLKLMFAAFICGLFSIAFIPLLLVTFMLLLCSVFCMIKNWKRINNEYKIRINK